MKNLLLLLPLAALLTACDNASGPLAYTAEMASFSNEFDFDPLRGPVKDFSQTLMDDKGDVMKQVSGKLSQEGCFDLLEFHDIENNSGATLILDANYYLDATSQEKRILLQGKCQLAGMPAAGISWDTDDNGFIVAAHGKQAQVKYRYDRDGYPLGKTSVSGDATLNVVATPSKDARKKMDYTAVSTLNDKVIGKVVQACDYDRHDNPEQCELKMTDESATPPVTRRYTIKNSIDYY